MTQREVQDENTTWTCVQAFAGLGDELADKAAEVTGNENGKVTVVCTPNGGAQTVRLELSRNWIDDTPDEELLTQIRKAQ